MYEYTLNQTTESSVNRQCQWASLYLWWPVTTQRFSNRVIIASWYDVSHRPCNLCVAHFSLVLSLNWRHDSVTFYLTRFMLNVIYTTTNATATTAKYYMKTKMFNLMSITVLFHLIVHKIIRTNWLPCQSFVLTYFHHIVAFVVYLSLCVKWAVRFSICYFYAIKQLKWDNS